MSTPEQNYIRVDKTGTLSEGKPKVTAVVPAAGFDKAEALRLAASVERASEHPLVLAMVAAARERNLPPSPWKSRLVGSFLGL